jgi:S1-C subfamily serine protease
MFNVMTRMTRLFLLGLGTAVVCVVLADVVSRRSASREAVSASAAEQPPGSPERRRGLDKTPLVYQATFAADLADRLAGSLVLAQPENRTGSAGGAIIDRQGHVLIANTFTSPRWIVRTKDGSVFKATPLARDAVHGVAMLHLADLPIATGIPFADQAPDAQPGPLLVLQPTPEGTATRVIPAPGQVSLIPTRLVQDEVPIGATVVTLEGAMAAFVGSGSLHPQPLGVAMLRQVVSALVEGRPHRHPWIGAHLQTIDPPLRAFFPQGRLVVVSVGTNSPAARAGLRSGDLIDSIGVSGRTIERAEDLPAALERASAITFERVSPSRDSLAVAVENLEVPPQFRGRETGLITEAPAPPGVRVTVLPGSRAASAGLQTGDLIEAVDRRPVASASLEGMLAEPSSRLLTVNRSGRRFFAAFPSIDARASDPKRSGAGS